MAASIPWSELKGTARTLRVLDPMAGSGTTLAVARHLGHKAIGFDTDPLAVLIAGAWCRDIDADKTRAAAKRVLARAKKHAAQMPGRDAYPRGADDGTRAFVRYWFEVENRKQLSALAHAIGGCRNEGMRVHLWCAFSRLIIAKQAGASRALDLAHSRPHRRDDKTTTVRPLDQFLSEVEKVCAAAPFTTGARPKHPACRLAVGDARKLPVRTASIDVVITSPPYLNGIDYQRMTKFTLVWMGYSVGQMRALRASNVGTEVAGPEVQGSRLQRAAVRELGAVRSLSARTVRMMSHYVRDMDAAMSEIARVLKPGGRAILVIGDSTVRGCFVRNSRALARLCTGRGLRIVRTSRRRLPPNKRYLPPPKQISDGFDARLRTEVVLHVQKPRRPSSKRSVGHP